MGRYFAILFICIYSFCIASGKDKDADKIDSLSRHYLTKISEETTDTGRIKLWTRYGNSIVFILPDSAQAIFRRMIAVSERRSYPTGVIQNYLALGASHMDVGAYDKGLECFQLALNVASKLTPPDQDAIEQLYNNIGAIYTYNGMLQEATEYYHKIAASTKSTASRVRSYNNLASILKELKDTTKALRYLTEAKKAAQQDSNAHYLLPYLYFNEANILYEMKRHDEAQKVAREALEIAEQVQSVSIQIDAIRLLGIIYNTKNEPEKAIEYYKRSLVLSKNNVLGTIRANVHLGEVYLSKHQYLLAEQYLNEALNIAEKINAKRDLINIYLKLVDYHKTVKHTDLALDYYKKAIELRDSIAGVEKSRTIHLMDVKYQVSQKDKEIAEKKFLIAQQRVHLIKKNTLIWSVTAGAGLITIILISFFFNRQRMQKQKQKTMVWQAFTEGEEKERLRLARELHDGIGGQLSTLKIYFETLQRRNPELKTSDDYTRITTLLNETVTEVRSTAHNLLPDFLVQKGLPEAVHVFCQNIQRTESLKIDFQYYGFTDRLNNSFELAVYRITQELIQNIIKHAKAEKAIIQLSQHNDLLDLTVEDNGIGISDDQLINGIGLREIQKRIKDLNGYFNIRSVQNKGTTIYIEFNLRHHKKAIT